MECLICVKFDQTCVIYKQRDKNYKYYRGLKRTDIESRVLLNILYLLFAFKFYYISFLYVLEPC